MNIIINGFHDKLISPIVTKIFNKLDVDYCEHISMGAVVEKPKISQYVQHDFRDLNLGRYPVDSNLLIPLDEKVILDFRNEEAIVMKMFDRLEQYIGRLSYYKRKVLFLSHLRYWNDILEKKQIDLFISSNIPHEIYDYIIYSLCKKRNIPTLMFYQSIPDFVFLLETWEGFMPEIKKRFDELIHASNANDKINLSPRAEHLWSSQTSTAADPTPVYMKKTKWPEKWRDFLKKNKQIFFKITHSQFYTSIFDHEKRRIFRFRIFGKYIISLLFIRQKQYYNKHCIFPEKDKKFIYLPLHYQPELTTSPIAGVFVDQILMVEIISADLPADIKIYVKENPKQKVWGREPDFYKKLLKIKGVCFISKKHNSFNLINTSFAVATATGTVGWEALFRGKPVLMFGNMFYQHAPGVFSIRQNKDCKLAFENIMKGEALANKSIMKLFVKSLDDKSLYANQQTIYQNTSSLSKEKNLQNLFDGLMKKIKQLGKV